MDAFNRVEQDEEQKYIQAKGRQHEGPWKENVYTQTHTHANRAFNCSLSKQQPKICSWPSDLYCDVCRTNTYSSCSWAAEKVCPLRRQWQRWDTGRRRRRRGWCSHSFWCCGHPAQWSWGQRCLRATTHCKHWARVDSTVYGQYTQSETSV